MCRLNWRSIPPRVRGARIGHPMVYNSHGYLRAASSCCQWIEPSVLTRSPMFFGVNPGRSSRAVPKKTKYKTFSLIESFSLSPVVVTRVGSSDAHLVTEEFMQLYGSLADLGFKTEVADDRKGEMVLQESSPAAPQREPDPRRGSQSWGADSGARFAVGRCLSWGASEPSRLDRDSSSLRRKVPGSEAQAPPNCGWGPRSICIGWGCQPRNHAHRTRQNDASKRADLITGKTGEAEDRL
jgi:hypothetical protein